MCLGTIHGKANSCAFAHFMRKAQFIFPRSALSLQARTGTIDYFTTPPAAVSSSFCEMIDNPVGSRQSEKAYLLLFTESKLSLLLHLNLVSDFLGSDHFCSSLLPALISYFFPWLVCR